MFSAIRSKNLSCENEAKFIQDRIAAVERTTSELSHVFSDYNRKAASTRDKSEDISKALLIFADGEPINKTLGDEAANFATCMSTISYYGNSRVNAINKKVLDELKEYEMICKRAKGEVRTIYAAREKEVTRKKTLDRLRERNPRNRHLILQAETEMVKASAEVTRTVHNLEEEITTFERQKIRDFKTILLDFIAVEMGYHARVLEVLTTAYNHVANINEESDIDEFKESLRLQDNIPHEVAVGGKGSIFRPSQSLSSLNSITAGKQSTERANRDSPGIIKHNLGIPRSSKEKPIGIQKAKSQDHLDNRPQLQKIDYDSETMSETGTSDQQSVKSDNVSPFLAKHFTK